MSVVLVKCDRCAQELDGEGCPRLYSTGRPLRQQSPSFKLDFCEDCFAELRAWIDRGPDAIERQHREGA